jgi:hypothetical protein
MHPRLRFTSLLALALLLCSTAARADRAAEARARDEARLADQIARTTDLYKRFTYQNVTSPDADQLFSSLQISSTFNPKNKMKNPDPEWIPGWDALALTDETKTAIVQAAVNRTWRQKVHQDYARYRAGWEAIARQFGPELERAAGAGYYAGGAALARLYGEVRKKAEAETIFYPPGTEPSTVGFVNDIIRAMVEVHRKARCEFLVGAYLKKLGLDLAAFQTAGRPFAADPVERELFTAFAQARGTLETPPLPRLREYGKAFAAVKWPTGKVAEVKAAAAKLVEAAAAALRPTVLLTKIAALFNGDHPDPADPKLRWVDPPVGGTDSYSPLLVTKVDPKGAGATAVLETKYDRSTPYDCKDTRTLDTTNSGRMYVQDCKYRHTITTHTLEVSFPELPEGLQLAAGDQVALYADLESKTDGKSTVKYKLTVRALATVKRGAKVIWE